MHENEWNWNISQNRISRNYHREVAHKTDSKWTLYSAITNVIHFVLNYEVVREPIVSGHLTSIFQCRVSFSLRIRFMVSCRV